jgi:hypothetical protein
LDGALSVRRDGFHRYLVPREDLVGRGWQSMGGRHQTDDQHSGQDGAAEDSTAMAHHSILLCLMGMFLIRNHIGKNLVGK